MKCFGSGTERPISRASATLPFSPRLMRPHIIKCSHGSGWNLVVRDNNAADYDAIRAQLGSGWLPTLESFLRAFWTMMTRDWGVARHPQL